MTLTGSLAAGLFGVAGGIATVWAPGASVVWSPAIERWGFWWFGNFMPM
jgi:hypothetical protein